MTPTVAGLIVILSLALVLMLAIGRVLDRKRQATAAVPDTPISFGHNMCWLAIRTEATGDVLQSLRLEAPRTTNWQAGLAAVNGGKAWYSEVFVSPPVDGWTFVVGLALPQTMGRAFEDPVRPLLGRLGRRFSDVQYFLNYPEFDYFSWQRCRDGRFVRVFAATDEGVVATVGRPTREEWALGLRLFELRGVRDRQGDAGGELLLHPTEEQVLTMARAWSLDPTRLSDRMVEDGFGFVGRAPASWKVRPVSENRPKAA